MTEYITENEDKVLAQIEKLKKQIKALEKDLDKARVMDAKNFLAKRPVILIQILFGDHDKYLLIKVGNKWRKYEAFKYKNGKFHIYDIEDCDTENEENVIDYLLMSNPHGDNLVASGFPISSVDNYQKLKATNPHMKKSCKKTVRKVVRRK